MTARTVEPPAVDLRRVVVLSPHFDDAVLSCASVMAAAVAATVVTIFGGRPDAYPLGAGAWDRRCGFRAGDDVVLERRAENARALKALDADDAVCELLDGQYRGSRRYRIDDVVAAVQPHLARCDPTTMVVPLGIGHRDHRLTCAAGLRLRARHRELTCLAYAEYPYAWREEDWEARRITRLRRSGHRLTPVLGIPWSADAKAAALAGYASQLTGLELDSSIDGVAAAPEHLWMVTNRPPLLTRIRRHLAYQVDRRRT